MVLTVGIASPRLFPKAVRVMIAQTTVIKVRRLLQSRRLSERKIAQTLGISRGTVQRIASGKRRDHAPGPSFDEGLTSDSGEVRRCPTCGGMVQMPCLLCRVRGLYDRALSSR